MKFLDLFSGIGGFRLGMEMAGHECVGHVEWDKYAQASYMAMHDVKESEYIGWDIRKVRADELPRADVWCFGFPCQDISIAGKTVGFNGQRSSLFFTVTGLIKQLEEKDKPTILFIENVKNLLSVNAGFDFARLLIELDEIGYGCEWEILNSKDYGVPQNRERVFIIGYLRGRSGREIFPLGRNDEKISVKQVGNIVDTGNWNNPQRGRIYGTDGISPALNCCGGGGLEPKIMVKTINTKDKNGKEPPQQDRVYQIDGHMTALSAQLNGRYNIAIPVMTPDRINKRQNGRRFKTNGEPMFTLTAQDRHEVTILTPKRTEYGKQIRKAYETGKVKLSRHDMTRLEPRNDGLTNTLTTVTKDNYLLVREATKKGFAIAKEGDSINLEQPNSQTRRGRVGKGIANTLTCNCNQGVIRKFTIGQGGQGERVYDKKGVSPALPHNHNGRDALLESNLRIRKLTPKECFRLQGFPDEYFEKAAAVNSNSQLYKQAGNSVTVNVIYEIAKRFTEIEGY